MRRARTGRMPAAGGVPGRALPAPPPLTVDVGDRRPSGASGPPADTPAPQVALLEAVLNSISDGVLVVDGDGEFVLINPAARFILDTDAVPTRPEEWQGAFGIFAADGVTPVPESQMPLVRALEGESPEQDDYVFRNGRNPHGALVTASARPLDPAAGVRGGGAVAVIRDVTAARVLQEEIRAERDRHESLLAVLSDLGEGVTIADDDEIVFVNDAYCALSGYSVDELVAQPPDRVSVDPESLEDYQRWRRTLAAHPGTPATMLTRVRHRDGHVVPVETMGIEVSERGRTRRVSVTRDLSERHRVQAELAERAAALAAANRELASANAALAVARDLATAASRAKSAFLATMSHEIRTPLNAVIGLTDIVLETDLGEVQREYLETVRNSGDTLIVLINDVLDWSKIESGSLDLEHRPFDLRDCVESAVDVFGAQVGDKDVDLLVDMQPGTPAFVVGDQTRLRQILVNLVGNALKFTPGGHVVVTTSAGAGPRDSGKLAVRLSVTDTGVGIPEEKLDRLFHDFSQVDESTTRTHGGTGLGLAISQRLAHAMGGNISVTSVPGAGSTFTVDVLLTEATAAEVPPASVVPGVLPGKRALVVDDNADNLRILAAQLAGWGLLVDLAGSGPEALRLLAGDARYDVGLIDFQLPGMDGLALLGELAALPAAAGLPVVMLTSVPNRVAVMGADHPPARHLTKPVHAVELRDALADVLGYTPAGPQAPVAGPEEVVESTLRVLLVEDSLVNRTVAQLMLTRIGYRVDVAVNGLAAVEAIMRTPYDVVFMDVRMPVMDGLEATRRLRLDPPPGPRPWIIALTASALDEDRVECAAAGMDDYLSKPIRREQLAGALSRAVG